MTYGKCPALSQFVDESAGLELSARKGLSVPAAVIGPSGRNHCFRGESSLPMGIKSVLSLRQIRMSTSGTQSMGKNRQVLHDTSWHDAKRGARVHLDARDLCGVDIPRKL